MGAATQVRQLARALLGVPLFYKLLIANSLIVIIGAVVGTALTAEFVRSAPDRSTAELVGWLAALGTLLSVGVNALILRWALVPVWKLEETANAVRSGDTDARASGSPLADRDFRRLTDTFNEMLDRARADRDRLRELASEATGAAEAERKRIARELHDDTAQSLAALLVRTRLLVDAEDPAARRERLDEMREQLARTLEDVRRMAHALRPGALEELGLGPAVQRHARSIEQAGDVRIEIDAPPRELRLGAEAELALYRIIQEAMSNAVRHAGASRIGVRLRREAEELVTIIEDDGRGFDVAAAMATGDRLGLFGMQERASYLGGRVEILSRIDEGTTVRVTLPLAGPDHG